MTIFVTIALALTSLSISLIYFYIYILYDSLQIPRIYFLSMLKMLIGRFLIFLKILNQNLWKWGQGTSFSNNFFSHSLVMKLKNQYFWKLHCMEKCLNFTVRQNLMWTSPLPWPGCAILGKLTNLSPWFCICETVREMSMIATGVPYNLQMELRHKAGNQQMLPIYPSAPSVSSRTGRTSHWIFTSMSSLQPFPNPAPTFTSTLPEHFAQNRCSTKSIWDRKEWFWLGGKFLLFLI